MKSFESMLPNQMNDKYPDVTLRFSLKFQKIVQDEQDANFITRLHGGKLNIIPWPVIESPQFYALFLALKRKLDEQPVTHPTAGEFLHKLKTLMAKLKVGHCAMLMSILIISNYLGERLGSNRS
jgi:hypothetical protein